MEFNSEFHTQIEAAMENGDYAAWKEAMGDKEGKVMDVVTADNFSQFAEAWKLEKSGDREGAQAIRESLGLRHPEGMARGHRGNREVSNN
jgi:hypothetical protein